MTSVPCRDLAVLFSTTFYVATSFLFSATDPCSQLPLSCCDLKWLSFHCLVTTWDLGRDLIVSFLVEIYVATLKVCRDFNSAPPVATSILCHNIFNCTTHSYCPDMNSRSRHYFSVTTNNIFFSCRDLKTVSRHYLL